MGKSGLKKKKGGANQNQGTGVKNGQAPVANGTVEVEASVLLKRALELKEDGNVRFQAKDYVGALQQYENALKLTPKTHPDIAVFHSNRAACLMQMKPIDYDAVIHECTMALQVQPTFVRALLRRARAFEAVGKYDMAMQDVQVLLKADPNQQDALDIARRLKTPLAPQDLQSLPSPAALGASAVGSAPIAGLSPCLPARPGPKKQSPSIGTSSLLPNNNNTKHHPVKPITDNGHQAKVQLPVVVLKPLSSSPKLNTDSVKDDPKEHAVKTVVQSKPAAVVHWRPLKLVYDHDIRLAQMPQNCSFRELRDVVAKRFPMSKSVLVKYKDGDGDLVTITSTAELRLAESSVADPLGTLKLHVVEVSLEQEPPLLEQEIEEEEEEEKKPVESDTNKPENDVAEKVKPETSGDLETKEVEMDDWLFEFAQLFRTHVGIDPDAHIDLHELGMELCSEALEETVTSEEAQALFEKATLKFQEVAALAFFNWGNVCMCAARKRIPIEDPGSKELLTTQLQSAYDWVSDKYSLAKAKYEEALQVKPDFYEGLLAIGQQQFEMAKLQWSFVLAKKEDLSAWDPTETFKLFDIAAEKMNVATEMLEKHEEQRAKELKDPETSKKDEVLRRRKKQGNGPSSEAETEISPEEAAEQVALMRSQIHLFWGNMLYERSQIECKLGLVGWQKNRDAGIERFKLAGASESDIAAVLKNHCSNQEVAAGKEAEKVTKEEEKEVTDNAHQS